MQNQNIITTKEILTKNYRITKPIKMNRLYSDFLGIFPADEQFSLLLHGAPGGGKSSFLLKLADELAKNYPILYGNLEEKSGTTLRNKLHTMKVRQKINFLGNNTVEEMKKEIDTGQYKFVIVDSISMFCTTERAVREFFEYVYTMPKTNFLFIAHQTKSGVYRGTTNLAHLVDVVLQVENGTVTIAKNRFHYSETNKEFHIFNKKIIKK